MCRREDVDGAGVVCGEEGARQAEGEGRAAGRRAADGEACDAGGVGGAHALEEARVDAHRVLEHDDAGHARARGGEGGEDLVLLRRGRHEEATGGEGFAQGAVHGVEGLDAGDDPDVGVLAAREAAQAGGERGLEAHVVGGLLGACRDDDGDVEVGLARRRRVARDLVEGGP